MFVRRVVCFRTLRAVPCRIEMCRRAMATAPAQATAAPVSPGELESKRARQLQARQHHRDRIKQKRIRESEEKAAKAPPPPPPPATVRAPVVGKTPFNADQLSFIAPATTTTTTTTTGTATAATPVTAAAAPSYAESLSKCGKLLSAGLLDDAWALFQSPAVRPHIRSPVPYEQQIAICIRMNQRAEMRRYFDDLLELNRSQKEALFQVPSTGSESVSVPVLAKPTIYTFNRVIYAYSRDADVDTILNLVERLKSNEYQLRMDEWTWTHLLDAVRRTGNLRQLIQLFRTMKVQNKHNAGPPPSTACYNVILTAIGATIPRRTATEAAAAAAAATPSDAGAGADAETNPYNLRTMIDLIHEMKETTTSQPDDITYRVILSALARSGDVSGMLDWWASLKKVPGLVYTREMFGIVIPAVARAADEQFAIANAPPSAGSDATAESADRTARIVAISRGAEYDEYVWRAWRLMTDKRFFSHAKRTLETAAAANEKSAARQRRTSLAALLSPDYQLLFQTLQLYAKRVPSPLLESIGAGGGAFESARRLRTHARRALQLIQADSARSLASSGQVQAMNDFVDKLEYASRAALSATGAQRTLADELAQSDTELQRATAFTAPPSHSAAREPAV